MHTVSNGLVVRSVDYRERDCILTVLTEELGRLTVSARGCRKKGSVLAAGCQLLCWSEMELYEHGGRWNVKAASTLRQFEGLRTDFEKFALACYIAEAGEALSPEGEDCTEILSLVLNSLHALEKLDRPRELVKAAFELRAMCTAGYEPMLDFCSVCGEEDPEEPMFHLLDGTLHCDGCREESDSSVRLTPSVLSAMRYITSCDPRRLFSFRMSDGELKNLGRITQRYLITQTDRSFHTLEYYRSLCPL